MHEFVSFNHRISPANQAKISGISSASFYGCGIFTTVAVYNSKPFLWSNHWQRLLKNAARIGIDLTEFSEENVKSEFSALLIHNQVKEGRARLTFFDESSTGIWQVDSIKKTSLLITTGDFRTVPNDWRLTVSPYLINSGSPLVNVKSANYLENLLAIHKAKENGFHEAIRLNERDEIVSACMANVFWIKDNNIFTPDAETGILQGTTRQFILKNFTVHQRKAQLEELRSADGIFLTSAGIGIAEIKIFDRQDYLFSNVCQQVKQFFIEQIKSVEYQ